MRKLLAVAVPTVLLAGGLAAVGDAATVGKATTGPRAGQVVKIADARLKFEINATDHDGGVQVFLDAEQWKRMSIFDPKGRRIFTTITDGIMGMQGGTELFMESAEPTFEELPLDQLLERWPAGRYEFRGVGLDGETLTGAARLTHDLPAGPVLVSPIEGDRRQDPNDTVVRWKRVPPANGSPIIGYQVLVVRPDTGMKALPNGDPGRDDAADGRPAQGAAWLPGVRHRVRVGGPGHRRGWEPDPLLLDVRHVQVARTRRQSPHAHRLSGR